MLCDMKFHLPLLRESVVFFSATLHSHFGDIMESFRQHFGNRKHMVLANEYTCLQYLYDCMVHSVRHPVAGVIISHYL